MSRNKQPRSWLTQLNKLAQSRRAFPSDDERKSLLQAIEGLSSFLADLKSIVSRLPDDKERDTLSGAASVVLEFVYRAKSDPSLSAMLGLGPANLRKTSAHFAKSTGLIDIQALVTELEQLPTEKIEARLLADKKLSIRDLSELARRLGLPAKSSDTREGLVDRIATVGFANKRGYDLLRGQSQ